MRVGLVNIFSFRPHVEHLMFLGKLLERAGHDVCYLTCDSSVSNCYARQLKGTSKVIECSQCIVGGVRSYATKKITSISVAESNISDQRIDDMCLSSSCTLTRTESEVEWNEAQVVGIRESLYSSVATTYGSTVRWINNNQLDGVICFNGRMDLTRGVIEACRDLGVPFITHERTWFGDGLNLTPNGNCLALGPLSKMVDEFSSRPLTKRQAQIAGKYIGDRFLQKNSLEWRLYNKNPEPAPWPINSEKGKRVLIIPSSKNEFAGHDDWKSGWSSNTDALNDFFECFAISPKNAVVRCHPNWSENIGRVSGERSLGHYRKWAKKSGVYFISSESKLSTYDLIQQADIVLVNGGSSSVEAGACGKQVICLGPSTYQKSGFVQTFMSKSDMKEHTLLNLDSDEIRRKTLRFIYVRSHRHPQFTRYVKALETTKYSYCQGADAERIIQMFSSGELEADDPAFSDSEFGEDAIVQMLESSDWGGLSGISVEDSLERDGSELLEIQRLRGLRWIDFARSRFSRGDR